MQFSLDSSSDIYTIRSYERGQVRINLPQAAGVANNMDYGMETGQAVTADWDSVLTDADKLPFRDYSHSLIVAPATLIEDWPPTTISDLNSSHFAQIAELQPEVVLLGTGGCIQWPLPVHTVPLIEQNIGLEIMDTGAACRTFNILACEGRRVAAALFMI